MAFERHESQVEAKFKEGFWAPLRALRGVALKAENYLQRVRGSGLLVGLLGLCGVFTLLSPHFLTSTNLLNIALQSSVTIVTSVGMTFVIASGGIDLSTGSVLALSGIIMAKAMKAGVSVPLSILAGLLIGALAGGINGSIIAQIRISPLIVTLAMMSVARAIALIITEARAIYGMPMMFRFLGSGYIGPIPTPFIIAMFTAGMGWILLERATLGRATLAIGGNEEAARLAGINTKLYKIVIYTLASLSSAIGAVITTARLNTAEPIAGYLAEMDAIAAVVMGGTALTGGEATIAGSIIGALIMATLRNGLTLLSVQPYLQQLTTGIVIVIAVAMDQLRRRR